MANLLKRNDTLTAQDQIFRELASLRDQVSRQAIQLDEVIRVQSITSTALRPPSDIQIRTEI